MVEKLWISKVPGEIANNAGADLSAAGARKGLHVLYLVSPGKN